MITTVVIPNSTLLEKKKKYIIFNDMYTISMQYLCSKLYRLLWGKQKGAGYNA